MFFSNKDQDPYIYNTLKEFNTRIRINPVISHNETILQAEQNQVRFTGERLVINQEIKAYHNNVLEEHICRYELACKLVKGKIVLDAACGAGYGAKMMEMAEAKQVNGIDISEECIHHAMADYMGDRISFFVGDVQQLPFGKGSFDVVVSFETIEHVPDGSAWIRESARVLKSKGLFIVSTPNRNVTNPGTFLCEQPTNMFHKFEYTITEFIGELLKEYDILELYGQTIVKDNATIGMQLLRQSFGRNVSYLPTEQKTTADHDLIPLCEIKNAQPAYVVAVCRKK